MLKGGICQSRNPEIFTHTGEIYRWYVRWISNQFNGVEQKDLNAGVKGTTVSPYC